MRSLITILFLFCFSSVTFAQLQPKKVLMIGSNLQHMGDPEKHDARNNLWEIAPPYHIFYSQGYDIDFVSPKGGQLHFNMSVIGISDYTIRHEGFLDKANASKTAVEINPQDYWAVYIGGGYGPLFDVASNPEIQNLIKVIYEQGGIIGTSGHGAGALVDVKLSNGQYLVAGKRIAGFPDSTEKQKSWAKQGSLLPFLVESKLRERGADAQNKKTLKDKHTVVTDQRIVSTMFLPPAASVAREMILLKKSQ